MEEAKHQQCRDKDCFCKIIKKEYQNEDCFSCVELDSNSIEYDEVMVKSEMVTGTPPIIPIDNFTKLIVKTFRSMDESRGQFRTIWNQLLKRYPHLRKMEEIEVNNQSMRTSVYGLVESTLLTSDLFQKFRDVQQSVVFWRLDPSKIKRNFELPLRNVSTQITLSDQDMDSGSRSGVTIEDFRLVHFFFKKEQCSICGKIFQSLRSLSRHLLRYHAKRLDEDVSYLELIAKTIRSLSERKGTCLQIAKLIHTILKCSEITEEQVLEQVHEILQDHHQAFNMFSNRGRFNWQSRISINNELIRFVDDVTLHDVGTQTSGNNVLDDSISFSEDSIQHAFQSRKQKQDPTMPSIVELKKERMEHNDTEMEPIDPW